MAGGCLALKPKRPAYAIVLFGLSCLWMGAVFLPLLYSILSPNKDLRELLYALEERGPAAPEAEATVGQVTGVAGRLTRAVPIAYYAGATATVHAGKSKTSTRKQASYVAWFQKRSKPLVLMVTLVEDDEGKKSYSIQEGEPMFFVRGYTLPVLAFGVTAFLVRRKEPGASGSTSDAPPNGRVQ